MLFFCESELTVKTIPDYYNVCIMTKNIFIIITKSDIYLDDHIHFLLNVKYDLDKVVYFIRNVFIGKRFHFYFEN